MGGWDAGAGGYGGAGIEACGVDIYCIQKGGIGPFGSPVAKWQCDSDGHCTTGSFVDSNYLVGGGYKVDWQIIMQRAGRVWVPGGCAFWSDSATGASGGECWKGQGVDADYWAGYVRDFERGYHQWWANNAYYRLGMSEQDYRIYQFSNMVTEDSTNVFTPCEAADVMLWVGGALVPAGGVGEKTLENIGKVWGTAGLLGLGCE